MPHTTRRAPAPPPSSRTKRATLPLDDGWSVVTTTKSARARPQRRVQPPPSDTVTTTTPGGGIRTVLAPAPAVGDLQDPQDSQGSQGSQGEEGSRGEKGEKRSRAGQMLAAHMPTGPMPIAPGMTKARVLHRVHTCRTRWAESACADKLRNLLLRSGMAGNGRVRRAVCLGLGSLSGENGALCARSVWQLVAFLDMVALVTGQEEGERVGAGAGAGTSEQVEVFAEDPVFNELDKEVLRDVGVAVLTAREGEVAASARHITSDSMVFAPFMPWFVMLPHFLKDRHPALYIGSDVKDMLEAAQRRMDAPDATRHDHANVLAAQNCLAQKRETALFPQFDLLDGALNPMTVSWVDDEVDEKEQKGDVKKEDSRKGCVGKEEVEEEEEKKVVEGLRELEV